jgi:hopanoid biosynthesis associated protein HpnK
VARLIVNADDLGLTGGVNRAIERAHAEGVVTSATLMANVPAFAEAVQFAKGASTLGVGCHIVLVDGLPVSPPRSVRSLLEGQQFRRKLWKFAVAAIRGKISSNEVEAEATAQIQMSQRAGIELTHVDCHKHAHMFPTVLEGVLRAAKRCGIHAIRNPFEPAFARHGGTFRSMETGTLHAMYAAQFVNRVREFGFATTDGSVGVTATGTLDGSAFEGIIRSLPRNGTYEFVCHPGYNDEDLAKAGTRLLESRESELALLCSAEARATLTNAGIELINFRQLVPDTESKPAVSHPMA